MGQLGLEASTLSTVLCPPSYYHLISTIKFDFSNMLQFFSSLCKKNFFWEEKEPEALKFDFLSLLSSLHKKTNSWHSLVTMVREYLQKENIFSLDKNYFRNFPFFKGAGE